MLNRHPKPFPRCFAICGRDLSPRSLRAHVGGSTWPHLIWRRGLSVFCFPVWSERNSTAPGPQGPPSLHRPHPPHLEIPSPSGLCSVSLRIQESVFQELNRSPQVTKPGQLVCANAVTALFLGPFFPPPKPTYTDDQRLKPPCCPFNTEKTGSQLLFSKHRRTDSPHF